VGTLRRRPQERVRTGLHLFSRPQGGKHHVGRQAARPRKALDFQRSSEALRSPKRMSHDGQLWREGRCARSKAWRDQPNPRRGRFPLERIFEGKERTKVEPEARAPDPASIWNSCRKAATFCNQIGRELGRTKGRLGLRRGHYYRSRKPKIVAVPQRHGVARSLSMLRRKSIDSRISKP